MSSAGPESPESPRRRPDGRVLVAAAVLLLAAAAVLIPRASREQGRRYLLVIDPLGGARRADVHESLAAWLGEAASRPLRLRLASSPAELAPAD
jgi:hypothetical protein